MRTSDWKEQKSGRKNFVTERLRKITEATDRGDSFIIVLIVVLLITAVTGIASSWIM